MVKKHALPRSAAFRPQQATRCAVVALTSLWTVFSLAGSLALAGEQKSEAQLIETLRTAAPAEKALACKHLATVGTKSAVPELAKLLADEQLATWARIALEAIPDPSADEALRNAAGSVKGKLLVGAINSLSVRRDAAAVDLLTKHLKDQDTLVASSAAAALGHIGNDPATKTLRQSLASTNGPVRNAVAEGCILCAERLLRDGRTKEAAEIYDEVRKADVPKPRKLEATRGAIVARQSGGIPLLLEQLASQDRDFFNIGLTTARELAGSDVAQALAAEVARTSPDRAALVLVAVADRGDKAVLPAVLGAAGKGDKQVRIAALAVVGRLGDATSVAPLLGIAADQDAELSEAAKAAVAALADKKVDVEITDRLSKAQGKPLAVLIELVGQRRVAATPALIKALDQSDEAVRHAALVALGATVAPQDLAVLITQAVQPKSDKDAGVAQRSLRAACLRMPDREACAAELAAALPRAAVSTKANLLETLGAMGGPKALETIGAAMKSNDPQLQDAGSRVLGEWMNVDAAPVLLDLAKTAPEDKYKVRALRGYIRLARQFAMPDAQRAEMCQTALSTSSRPEEQKLVLAVLERYPNLETLKVAVKATQIPALRDDAAKTTLTIARKVGGGGDGAKLREVLSKSGLDPVKVDIVKAEYGAGDSQKDVTQTLQKCVDTIPLILLPAANYNDSFGGDPAPGTPKILKVQYQVNGKAGDVTFPENAPIVLPMP